MVQLEVKVSNAWREVIRYDCSHDYAHKGCYNIKGECRKINLYLDYEDALTLADDDINENREIYKERFLRGGFPYVAEKDISMVCITITELKPVRSRIENLTLELVA